MKKLIQRFLFLFCFAFTWNASSNILHKHFNWSIFYKSDLDLYLSSLVMASVIFAYKLFDEYQERKKKAKEFSL